MYIIFSLILAGTVAAAQVFLCKKSKSVLLKLLPIFSAAAMFLLAAFIRGENFLADAVYGIFGRGIFAIIVILRIGGISAAVGSIVGLLYSYFKK